MPTPTFNKYKSTTIYGNLSVRDLTNSSGSSVIEVASVDLSGNFLSRGDSTFTKAVVCNASVGDINANNKLATKEYVDNAVSTGGAVSLTGTNNFTGTNTFNTNLPTSNLGSGAISGTEQFLTKGIMDNIYARKANINNWTNQNTFDSYLPTSTQTPTSASQLTTKTFVDGAISGLSSVYQTIAGMSSYLTTATASSTYSTLTNQVKTNTSNTFTGTNTFNDLTTLGSVLEQTSTTGINSFYASTDFHALVDFYDEISQTNITIPSGKTNTFIASNFLEEVTFSQAINFNVNTDFQGTTNTFTSIQIANAGASAPITMNNGAYITQTGAGANKLTNLTIDGGILTQLNNTTTNTMANLKVKTIATEPIIVTQTSENYSSVKMRNYVFHSRTTTTASGITLSTDGNIDDGQYLYVRKISSGVYTLTLTASSGTTFLNLSNSSVSTIAITNLLGVSFVYDKTNTRWIQLT